MLILINVYRTRCALIIKEILVLLAIKCGQKRSKNNKRLEPDLVLGSLQKMCIFDEALLYKEMSTRTKLKASIYVRDQNVSTNSG